MYANPVAPDVEELNKLYTNLFFTQNGEVFCVSDIVRLEWVQAGDGTRRLRMYPHGGGIVFALSQAESQAAYTKWLSYIGFKKQSLTCSTPNQLRVTK